MKGRPRTPLAIVQAEGRDLHDPQRYKGRKLRGGDPLGEPPGWLEPEEHAIWCREAAIMPWLRAHHRMTFASWCRVCAMLEEGCRDWKMFNTLRQISNIIGANPVSDQKFKSDDEEEQSRWNR